MIVPAQSTSGFGSLFQIFAEDNELFISSATVDNVEIINTLSAEKLKASGTVVTSSDVATSTTTGTVSTTASTSSTTSSSTSGSTTSGSTSSGSSSSSSSSSGGYY